MNRLIAALLALTFSSGLYAQCSPFALHGDWTVFYRDDAAPDSILTPGGLVEIRYLAEHDQFSVQLKDPYWSARRNTWNAGCVDDAVVLTGVLQERSGADRVMVEMSRVTDERDLLAHANGLRRLDQISIRVMECVGLECDFAERGADSGETQGDGHEHPAADPGHAHADR